MERTFAPEVSFPADSTGWAAGLLVIAGQLLVPVAERGLFVTFSRFYLCDLQVHTPADPNQGYGNTGGREPNPAFARRLIQAHADAGVELIAVTDHNRV